MKKYIFIFTASFLIIFLISLLIFFSVKKHSLLSEQAKIEAKNAYMESINYDALKNSLLSLSEWVDITDNDKITFALGSLTPAIERVISSLENNTYVILYIVGGRFDPDAKGDYIILTGFDKDGKVKILAPINNYVEKSYIFERVFENAAKIMFFDRKEA
jgi:hypothetical protein